MAQREYSKLKTKDQQWPVNQAIKLISRNYLTAKMACIFSEPVVFLEYNTVQMEG